MRLKKASKLLSAFLTAAVFLSTVSMNFAAGFGNTAANKDLPAVVAHTEDEAICDFSAGHCADMTVTESVYENSPVIPKETSLPDNAPETPATADKKIVSILTDYKKSVTVVTGSLKEDIMPLLPASFTVLLENGNVTEIPVKWDSMDYNGSEPGTYTFESEFDLDSFVGITNPDNIKGTITVEVISGEPAPEMEGFITLYYTTFGDIVPVTPENWGFTTSNAQLSINTDNIRGNGTPKLQFSMVNQSGGRVATRIFEPSVKGDIMLVKFDWYPGPINDKGSNPQENGGEFRIEDSSKNTVFTINNTRNSPLKFSVGNSEATYTSFTNAEKWYGIEIYLNILENKAILKITDKETNTTETYERSLEGINFDGSINNVKLAGVRTAGNNITWTTYLDNFGIYVVLPPDNRVAYVEKLRYHRVYVGETTEDISSIGLPREVPVVLVNGERVTIPVDKWVASGKEWNPEEAGVYTFTGYLAETDEYDNAYNRTATLYVYNRLPVPNNTRQAEWLDRGVIALSAENGIFVSWRLRADEYGKDVKFNIYRNGIKLNGTPLYVTNYLDTDGKAGDKYRIETLLGNNVISSDEVTAADRHYISVPVQKPADGVNRKGETYTYSLNDTSVGDLDGDGEYEIIVKWYPSNAIDSSQSGLTGPTIFDAYKLDGTLLWRMNMGLNLTSGAHYHQFLVYDFDGDGRSEMFIKTADGTTVYGATDGIFDENKIICQIGNPEDDGKYINDDGKTVGGPEYISIFDGETGEVIDTIEYEFPVNYNPEAWGDGYYNRSDRFLAAVAYLDGKTPSAVFGRGYYERTTFVAYKLVNGKLVTEWVFDTFKDGRQYEGLGNHNLSVADVDNDGCDEIIAGALTLDNDGTVLYAMDGQMNREKGSHGDAMHVGAFDPDVEGLQVFSVFEVPSVASMQYRDAATGETLMSFYASKDTGRGVAANITSDPGYEFWGTADLEDVQKGAGLYNVKGKIVENDWRALGLSANFALYWDGDLHHELLDDIYITKYNEITKKCDVIIEFTGCVSNNGTKATPSLQADILGDWREEVIMPSEDSTELRIYSTTIPTEYRIYTLMHDPVYRLGIAWQNVAYNQPPHISFYLGEDIRDRVLAGGLNTPKIYYTEKIPPTAPNNLRIANIGRTDVTLAWDAATDNAMVEGYEIYVNGTLHGRTSGLSYLVTGLSSGTEYTFAVNAYDISGNRSEAAVIKGRTESAKTDSSTGKSPGGSSRPIKAQPTPSLAPAIIPKQTVKTSEPVINAATGEALVTVGKENIITAFENSIPDEKGVKTVIVEIPEAEGVTSYAASIDASVLTNVRAANERIELKTPYATLVLPGNMLSNSYSANAGEIIIKIGTSTADDLSGEIKTAVGNRPVVELGLYLNNKPIEFDNPNASVLVKIPYVPTEEELKWHENIIVLRIDRSGNAEPVPTGWYNPANGMVEFKSDNFSKYAIAHSFKTFEDLDGYDWVRKEIEVLAARGIIKGTSPATYKPADNLTRADFVLLLTRALGLNARIVSNFSDVYPADYYYDGMGIAKALGIVKGTGGNMGSPRETITRQEMMVMAARALRLTGKLDEGTPEDLAGITDREDISDYALADIASLVKSGIIPEDQNSSIRPLQEATRAEAAKLLYMLCKKQILSE
ncbi:S-layer homology domain-containing protein [Thermoclostridium stercorarium]|uniref:rhamnogalacturonan lyase family protein n=1 Tax=Thermoclostridium stercorarium TaxID=1510 RepID=UPI0022496A6F|nr:S-layer homology domain-containing protein [Thermoclostridium stercorarium]UZQ86204.1 S-layer homology domain-containing protein [Thermoclostridium stercorarium]